MRQIHVTAAMRQELEDLHAKHGELTADLVVRSSRRKSSALHSVFHWEDPDKAAEIGRVHIAHVLICSVKILPSEAEDMQCSVKVRKFYGSGTGEGYREITQIMTDKTLREGLLSKALQELQSFQERYAMLKELADVFAAIRKVGRKKPRK